MGVCGGIKKENYIPFPEAHERYPIIELRGSYRNS